MSNEELPKHPANEQLTPWDRLLGRLMYLLLVEQEHRGFLTPASQGLDKWVQWMVFEKGASLPADEALAKLNELVRADKDAE